MKSASFDYVAPTTVAVALDALAGSADGRILAGGQSLMPMLALRLATPELVVDLGGIAALRRVELAGERQVIGAMVTHAAIEDGIHDFADGGMLAAVAGGVAYRAVRNRGTLAGSIAHADPAADWPTALTALDAGVIVAGRSGEHEIAVGAFFRGAFATALQDQDARTGGAQRRDSLARIVEPGGRPNFIFVAEDDIYEWEHVLYRRPIGSRAGPEHWPVVEIEDRGVSVQFERRHVCLEAVFASQTSA